MIRALAVASAVTIIACGVASAISPDSRFPFGSFGRHDLFAFWAAVQQLTEGQSPYDLRALLEIKASSGVSGAVLTHNPPWTLLLLYPFFAHSFSFAIVIWLVLNIFLLVLAASLALPYLSEQLSISRVSSSTRAESRTEPNPVFALLFLFCFIPAHLVLALGQLSILVLASLMLGLVLFRHENDFLSGVAFSLALIKPHIVLVLLVGILATVIRSRRYAWLFGLSVGLIALLAGAVLIRPTIFIEWGESLASAPNQQSATLVAFIRLQVQEWFGIVPHWPVYAIPGAAVVATAIWFIRFDPHLRFEATVPYLLCLSLLFAPHAWLYDSILLVPVWMSIVKAYTLREHPPRTRFVLFALLASTQILLALGFLWDRNGSSFFWFPAVMLGMWILAQRECRRSGFPQ